eukprot:8085758-Alexandrium_andersonii.AAC.1
MPETSEDAASSSFFSKAIAGLPDARAAFVTSCWPANNSSLDTSARPVIWKDGFSQTARATSTKGGGTWEQCLAVTARVGRSSRLEAGRWG